MIPIASGELKLFIHVDLTLSGGISLDTVNLRENSFISQPEWPMD